MSISQTVCLHCVVYCVRNKGHDGRVCNIDLFYRADDSHKPVILKDANNAHSTYASGIAFYTLEARATRIMRMMLKAFAKHRSLKLNDHCERKKSGYG